MSPPGGGSPARPGAGLLDLPPGRVVAVSPHLDDAAFSAGGLLAALADRGWRTAVVTCLTATVPSPRGFALACQTDKGLAPDVDYMALRRGEDRRALAHLGVDEVEHVPLREAPHRGYDSAPALFAGVRPGDDLAADLTGALRGHLDAADLVLAPQGLGAHVDHLQVVRAVRRLGVADRTAWWRDTPYVVRDPAATASRDLPAGLVETAVDVEDHLEAKTAACREYATQLGFQFGGPGPVATVLLDLALAEGERCGLGLDRPAEALLAPPALLDRARGR